MTRTDPQRQRPVEIRNPSGASPVVILCEHASNFIPAEYGDLGLAPAELQRHIAWDIGAAGVARRLSDLLDAPAFLGEFSRLLIDLNRPLHSASSIVTRSEATDIPGNASLSRAERDRRAGLYFDPFHREVEQLLAHRNSVGAPVLIVAIHSFTPSYHGVPRPWHAGIIYDQGAEFAEATLARLRENAPGTLVGANVPYAVTPDEYYGLLVYGDNIGNPAILVEIRQDLLEQPDQQNAWAERLAASLAIPRIEGT